MAKTELFENPDVTTAILTQSLLSVSVGTAKQFENNNLDGEQFRDKNAVFKFMRLSVDIAIVTHWCSYGTLCEFNSIVEYFYDVCKVLNQISKFKKACMY